MASDKLIELLKAMHDKATIVEVSIRREVSRYSPASLQIIVYLQAGGTLYHYVDDETAEKVRQYAQEISGQ